jgi:hypothetical protein
MDIDKLEHCLKIFIDIRKSYSKDKHSIVSSICTEKLYETLIEYNTSLEKLRQFCLIELKHVIQWNDVNSINEALRKVRDYRIDNILN